MGFHVQRKRFEAEELARETVHGFKDKTWTIPNVEVVSLLRNEGDQWWVYVLQVGDWVTGNEPALPGYDVVASG